MMTRYRFYRFALLFVSLLPFGVVAEPLFDAHLHYSAADAEVLTSNAIIEKLDNNGIRHAVVTGTPARHAKALYNCAPDRIVPMLGLYHSYTDKESWTKNDSLPAMAETELEHGGWRGIGELHIFARDRFSPVFKRIVEIAASRRLPVLLHADPAVIDTAYTIAPAVQLVWAHAGTFPYPDLVTDYLQRYPTLIVDLSMRDERIAPQGKLDDAWYELLVTYPERFVVGVDTYSLSRWQQFDDAAARIKNWLEQLPQDVAQQLAYDNAARVYGKQQ